MLVKMQFLKQAEKKNYFNEKSKVGQILTETLEAMTFYRPRCQYHVKFPIIARAQSVRK